MSTKELSQKLKPSVPKRHLLLVAAFVWLFAGGFLMFRGVRGVPHGEWSVWNIVLSGSGGLLFFWIVFLRISARHIRRISTLEILRPCVFSFFDFKSYLLMGLMIGMGITVRKVHLVNDDVISWFFISMSIPLLISAVRFFLAWKRFRSILNTESPE